MPFAKGASGNPRGRKLGSQNKVAGEIKRLARGLFDQDYWERVKRQAKAGELNPKIEALLLNYAYGMPQGERDTNTGVTVNLGFITAARPTPALGAPIIEGVSHGHVTTQAAITDHRDEGDTH